MQICPTFPPNIGGVGNYAKILSDHLKKKKIRSKILISDHLDNKNNKKNLFGKKNKNLLLLLENNISQNVILHFSGYGYASRGLCFNLIKSLEIWKQNKSNRKLITIFHEIYATGPFYRMSFWTSFLQKYLAKKLYRLSDICLATSKQNQFILSSFGKKKKIIYSNVFSNVGELKKNKKIKERKKNEIIFGNTYQKKILYKDIVLNKNKYEILLKKMSVTEIIDIGPKVNISKSVSFKTINLKSIGIRTKSYISYLLANSKVGLVYYPVGQMTKSGIVAAYAAHGLVIINFCKKELSKFNEFISGVNYLSYTSGNLKNILQKLSNESYKNYNKYALNRTASLIIKNLKT